MTTKRTRNVVRTLVYAPMIVFAVFMFGVAINSIP